MRLLLVMLIFVVRVLHGVAAAVAIVVVAAVVFLAVVIAVLIHKIALRRP